MALPSIINRTVYMRGGGNRGVKDKRRFGAWIRELSMRAVGREMARVLSFSEATKPHDRMGYAGGRAT